MHLMVPTRLYRRIFSLPQLQQTGLKAVSVVLGNIEDWALVAKIFKECI